MGYKNWTFKPHRATQMPTPTASDALSPLGATAGRGVRLREQNSSVGGVKDNKRDTECKHEDSATLQLKGKGLSNIRLHKHTLVMEA